MGLVGVESRVRLVGRAVELEVLRAVVEDAAAGRLRIVLLEGEAGIGKTRLIAEALAFARARGFRVFSGVCDEVERDSPLRALSEALEVERGAPDPTRAELARLLEAGPPGRDVHGAGTADEGWLIVEAVLNVLEEFASTAPIALVVEDLQWADPLTLRALHSIARHLTRLPLALLATVRGGSHGLDVDRAIADLLARGAEHVLVGSLSSEEAAHLAGEVVGLQAGPRLLAQVGGAGGNPLFVIELVRALDDEGAIDVLDGRAEALPASPPPTLRLTLLRRLSLLPDDALNLLRVASILGSTFSLTELSLLAGRNPALLVPALAAAIDAGLLTESGDRLAFRHDLVRDALYHDLPASVRKGLHRQAGAVLAGAGIPVERVAGHVALGAEQGDAEAVGWLRRAAQFAAGRAPATTVRLLERALEISDPSDPIRDAIAAELVEPLLLTGRLRDAETVGRNVLSRGHEPWVDVMVRTTLASVLSIGARYPEGIHQLEQASIAAPEEERQSLAAAGSVLMLLAGQVERARDRAEQAVEMGERLNNDHALCLGLQTLSMAALAEGFVDRAASMAQRAVTVAQRGDAAWANHVVPELWLGTALADSDRLGEAEVVLQAGRWRAEQTGDLARLPLYYWAIADARLSSGQWDDAVAEAQAGLGLIEENANRVGDVFAYALCAHVALHRGDPSAAQSAVKEARRSLVAGPLEIGFEWMTWIDALLLETLGQPAQALSILEQAWDLIAPLRYLQAMSRAMGPDLVRMALSAGDQQRAVSVTEELERSARRSPAPTARGLALRCRGLVDHDPDVLLEAVAAHRSGPRPYLLAAACEDAAVTLGHAARADEAVPLLNEAVAAYERLEAVWDVARVRSVQRTLGIAQLGRAPRRPSFGWNSLTPTEVKVVSIVAEGLTNRQIAERLFVSRRTVATHIEHVFQKLGHANRVELAADAVRRAISDQTTPTAQPAPEAAQANPRRQPPVPPRVRPAQRADRSHRAGS
jgi:DNA-binding NarL/FixJ family response regulator